MDMNTVRNALALYAVLVTALAGMLAYSALTAPVVNMARAPEYDSTTVGVGVPFDITCTGYSNRPGVDTSRPTKALIGYRVVSDCVTVAK